MADAIKAGQGPAELIVKVGENLFKPLLLMYFLWPMMKPIFYGPEAEAIPEEPITWAFTIAKWALYLSLLATFVLLMIFTRQESMLYVPAQPI